MENAFGKIIGNLRHDKRVTLERVSRALGTHKGYVSGWESGKVNPPSPKFVKRLARFYRVDYLDLQEIAFVCKAPIQIRKRMFRAVASNPLMGSRKP